MKKFDFVIAAVAALVSLASCGSSKTARSSIKSEVWQTMLIKQLDTQIDDQIITVKYSNGSTLCYKILDNFGNISLTWDRTNGRTAADQGESAYKGDISIPSFVTAGANDEFSFRVMEIDEKAFYGCKDLKSVEIPFSVMRILGEAFNGCSSLEKFVVNENNQSYKSEDDVLYSKDNRMLIYYPAAKTTKDYVISEDISLICADAFMANKFLENITIGNFVTAISDNAFKDCSNLKTVELGGNVRIIGQSAFLGCNKIERINSRGFFPPHNCPTVYETVTKETCKLYVPKGHLTSYKRRLEWGEFKNIQEY